jgi:hypothetical protein
MHDAGPSLMARIASATAGAPQSDLEAFAQ